MRCVGPSRDMECPHRPLLTDCKQMRLLYGRRGPSNEPIKFATFSVDEEYKQNEMDKESGLAQEAKPVRTVAPGRHQLQSLLNGVSPPPLWKFGSSGTAGFPNTAPTLQLPNPREAPWKRALPAGNPIAKRLLRDTVGDRGGVFGSERSSDAGLELYYSYKRRIVQLVVCIYVFFLYFTYYIRVTDSL